VPVANPPPTLPLNLIAVFLCNQLVSEIVTIFPEPEVAVTVSVYVEAIHASTSALIKSLFLQFEEQHNLSFYH